MAEYDLVVRNGTLATASDVFRADIGVVDGRIVTIGAKVGAGRREIDAEGRIVTPGGIDSHCHIAQRSSMGVMTADDFFTATRSAACGGTTTGQNYIYAPQGGSGPPQGGPAPDGHKYQGPQGGSGPGNVC